MTSPTLHSIAKELLRLYDDPRGAATKSEFAAAFSALRTALSQEEEGWISAEERLPEMWFGDPSKDHEWIVTDGRTSMFATLHHFGGSGPEFVRANTNERIDPTHWMPLPKPPAHGTGDPE